MATFVVAKDATPEELADFMRLLGEVQPAGTGAVLTQEC